jgi:hypothetical protein
MAKIELRGVVTAPTRNWRTGASESVRYMGALDGAEVVAVYTQTREGHVKDAPFRTGFPELYVESLEETVAIEGEKQARTKAMLEAADQAREERWRAIEASGRPTLFSKPRSNPSSIYDEQALEAAKVLADAMLEGQVNPTLKELWEYVGEPSTDPEAYLRWSRSVCAVMAAVGGYVFNPRGEPVTLVYRRQPTKKHSFQVYLERPRHWPVSGGIGSDEKLRQLGMDAIDEATTADTVVMKPLLDKSEVGLIVAYPSEGAYVIRRKVPLGLVADAVAYEARRPDGPRLGAVAALAWGEYRSYLSPEEIEANMDIVAYAVFLLVSRSRG